MDSALRPFSGKRVLLAVSGGPDSRALMEIVGLWKNIDAFEFLVVSVDHQTRDESSGEARAVCERADFLGLRGRVLTLDPALKKDEASLRKARYEALIQCAEEVDATGIVTAHHQDDEAEGFVMDLLGWGGGTSGAGMPVLNRMADVCIIRPFLELPKKRIVEALLEMGIHDYVRDPADLHQQSRRAQVRHGILPILKKHHPSLSDRLSKRARNLVGYENTLQKLADQITLDRWDGESVILPLSLFKTELMAERLLQSGMALACGVQDFRKNGPQLKKIIDLLGIDPFTDSVTLSGSLGRNTWVFDVTAGMIGVSLTEIRIRKKN